METFSRVGIVYFFVPQANKNRNRGFMRMYVNCQNLRYLSWDLPMHKKNLVEQTKFVLCVRINGLVLKFMRKVKWRRVVKVGNDSRQI